MKDRPRFLADVMLGTLAKWLRILGYDTEYDNRIEDDEIVRRCLEEGRVALTRDQRLARRRELEWALLIESDDLRQQLRQVLRFAGSGPDLGLALTRCVHCNVELQRVPAAEVAGQIPPYVQRTQKKFKRCPRCRRVFWKGTHRRRIIQGILELKDD